MKAESRKSMQQKVARARSASLPVVNDRPRTYAECIDRNLGTFEDPCPYVSCEHHLALGVGSSGSILFGTEHVRSDEDIPEIDVGMMEETCTLRVIEQGEQSVRTISRICELTPARLHAMIETAMEKLRDTEIDELPAG